MVEKILHPPEDSVWTTLLLRAVPWGMVPEPSKESWCRFGGSLYEGLEYFGVYIGVPLFPGPFGSLGKEMAAF